MDKKMFIQPAIRVSLIAAVIIGLLILIGVTWWVAVLSVLVAIAVAAAVTVFVVKRQRKQFTERLMSFNIDPNAGRVNPADLKRMYNSGGQNQKDAVTIYRAANNNCSEAEAHKFFKSLSVFNRAEQMKTMQQQMQATQGKKGKGKGRGAFR